MATPPLVLITGASQGIGAALALVFAREAKARLLLVARHEANLRRTARACLRAGAGAAEVFPCDVSDEKAVAAMAEAVHAEFGTPGVLINNAGLFRAAPLLEMETAAFDHLLAANLRSAFLVTRAFVPAMVRRRQGHVFFMSSIAGLDAYPGGGAYCAAKFGVTGLAKVLRAELLESGVRVTTVFPGATVSPSWKGSGAPQERMMPAADVARAFFDAYRLSRRTVVEEIVLRPQRGDL